MGMCTYTAAKDRTQPRKRAACREIDVEPNIDNYTDAPSVVHTAAPPMCVQVGVARMRSGRLQEASRMV